MRRMLTVLLLALLPVAPASAAPPSATTVPGWPRAIPAGTVLPGPGGGVVVVWRGEAGVTVRAFARDGRRLWSTTRDPDCGNCDDGPQPEALQPDGTYGPIGDEGDDSWAVDARGRIVEGCTGVVSADGACVAGAGLLSPLPPSLFAPGVRGRTASGVTWTASDPGWGWAGDVPPMAARDAAGIVYVAFADPARASGGEPAPGLLMAVDPSARAVLWTRLGPTEVLTGLDEGVLVSENGGITAVGPDGVARWARPLAAGQRVRPAEVVNDAPRGRVYVGRTGGARPGVTALDAATGAQAWRTRPADRARLLSVGRGGRVYVAVDRPGLRAVRAMRIAGGVAWERRTRIPALSARELADGTVAVSAGARYGHGSDDRLTLLDPRR